MTPRLPARGPFFRRATLLRGQTSVGDQRVADHEGGLVRREKQHRACNFRRVSHASDRRPRDRGLLDLGMFEPLFQP